MKLKWDKHIRTACRVEKGRQCWRKLTLDRSSLKLLPWTNKAFINLIQLNLIWQCVQLGFFLSADATA